MSNNESCYEANKEEEITTNGGTTSSSLSSSSSLSLSRPISCWSRWWDTIVLEWIRTMNVSYPIEWFLAWITVLAFCMKYILDYLQHVVTMRWLRHQPQEWCRHIPLVTLAQTRDRLENDVALQQLKILLTQNNKNNNNDDKNSNEDDDTYSLLFSDDHVLTTLQSSLEARRLASAAMIPHYDKTKKTNQTTTTKMTTKTKTSTTTTIDDKKKMNKQQENNLALERQLQRLWPQLLQFPKSIMMMTNNNNDKNDNNHNDNKKNYQYLYDLSLIVPAYNENPISILITLTTAWKNCSYNNNQEQNQQEQNNSNNNNRSKKKHKIQVIIVNAGKCGNLTEILSDHITKTTTTTTTTNDDNNSKNNQNNDMTDLANNDKNDDKDDDNNNTTTTLSLWSHCIVMNYNQGGGRGGCMNFGAQYAQGRILCFLHADVLLPNQWDTLILQELLLSSSSTSTTQEQQPNQTNNKKNKNSTGKNTKTTMTTLCAFGMGIDSTSLHGLHNGKQRYPPGLAGAAWQGRIRSNWCVLPFGDSIISIHASIFHYIGGFPNKQPLLEDYELVQLFRKRAGIIGLSLFPTTTTSSTNTTTTNTTTTERIAILPANIQCSPRRWQRFNVMYVALANWTFLERYKAGTTAEDLYDMYYGTTTRTSTTTSTTCLSSNTAAGGVGDKDKTS